MSLSEFFAPLPRMPGKGERGRRRSPPSVTIRHESLPGVSIAFNCSSPVLKGDKLLRTRRPRFSDSSAARQFSQEVFGSTAWDNTRETDRVDGDHSETWKPATILVFTSMARVSHGRPVGSRFCWSTTMTSTGVWSIAKRPSDALAARLRLQPARATLRPSWSLGVS
jgi:hypothetical protein